jgi:hypothetical protein
VGDEDFPNMTLARNLEGKKSLMSSRFDCNTGIEINPREIGFEVTD